MRSTQIFIQSCSLDEISQEQQTLQSTTKGQGFVYQRDFERFFSKNNMLIDFIANNIENSLEQHKYRDSCEYLDKLLQNQQLIDF